MAGEVVQLVDSSVLGEVARDAKVPLKDALRLMFRIAGHPEGERLIAWLQQERARVANEKTRKDEAAEAARRRARGER